LNDPLMTSTYVKTLMSLTTVWLGYLKKYNSFSSKKLGFLRMLISELYDTLIQIGKNIIISGQ